MIKSVHHLTLILLILGLLWPTTAFAAPTELFFSEYIEGSSNNKAIEIYNGTGAAIDLAAGGYDVQMFFNGSISPGLTIVLTGTVADGDVYVIAQATADPIILAQADQTNGAGWFNGDDAVVLRKGGVTVDVIGQIGFDPGSEWGTGVQSTADNTLRRKSSIMAGDTNGGDAFDPSIEWDGFAQNTFDGLGSHTIDGGVINEPVVAVCGGPLNTDEGTAATTSVSASDVDGIVVDLAITSVTPSPAPGTISLSNLVPAAGVGLTATADITVDASAPAGVYSVLVTATNNDGTPQTGTCTLSINVAAPPTTIHDIQGASHISPKNGQFVSSVPGIVTAVRSNGFFMQDPNPDSDEATSEAILVFTSSAPTVSVGDAVLVSGTVSEFRPGGSSSTNLTTTEITSPGITVTSSGNPLPAATILGVGGRVPPTEVIDDDAIGDVETSGTFDPATDGLDFYESLEGMYLQINNAVAVGPTNDFGEIPVVSDDGANASVRTTRGGIVVRASDFNPERIFLDDVLLLTPVVDVGDHFTTPVIGVLDYSFGNFKLLITQALTASPSGLAQETAAAADPGQLSIATFNVENLDPGDGAAKFDALANLIVNHLASPDLIALEEIQDNNGPVNDSLVDATDTYTTLIAAIQTAGGPTYDFRNINPVDDLDGGEPGGNIRVGFLFRTDRGLAFVDRPGGDSTTATTVVSGGSGPELSFSPGRIDPTNSAFNTSRKPLAGEFTFNGVKLFIIANHFNSKGGDQPLFGHFQPPTLSSEVQRLQQAQVVNDFVDALLTVDSNANVVVLGDFNDFEFSNPLVTLKGGVLTDLMDTLPQSERYTYVFEGNSQALDHILVSDPLFNNTSLTYDVVHVNSEFADQVSDHDPQVVLLSLDAVAPSTTASLAGTSGSNGWYVSDVTVTLSADDGVNGSGVSVTEYNLNGGAWTTYSGPFSLTDEGITTVNFRSTDNAGNVEATQSVEVKIDLTASTTTASLVGTAGGNGWYVSDVTVTLSADDGASGSGVSATEYNLNGGAWTTYSGPFSLTDEGITTVNFRSTDNAGNVEATQSVEVKIDQTTPSTTASLAGTSGSNGWYVSDVTVTLSADDGANGSGVSVTEYNLNSGAWAAYSGPFTLTDEGITTVNFRSTDNAGNVEATQSVDVNIDLTAPEASLVFVPALLRLELSGTDATSGIDSITPATLLPGTNTYVITDMAGHTLTLVLTDQQTARSETITLDSLAYDGGATILPPTPTRLKVSWNIGATRIQQIARSQSIFTAIATWLASSDETLLIISRPPDPVEIVTEPGLALLRLFTHNGAVDFDY